MKRLLIITALAALTACGAAVATGTEPDDYGTTTTHKTYDTTTTVAPTTAATTTTVVTPNTQGATTTTHAATTTDAPTTTGAATTTTSVAAPTTSASVHKVFVCKYVGTPGLDERLQTGDNPISVDTNSLRNFVRIGDFFNDAQGRSVAIAFDTGQPEPSVSECPNVTPTTSTTTASTTSTTSPTTTTTTQPGTTTTFPTPGLFAIEVTPTCPDGTLPEIEITFGDRPDLDGQTGTLTFDTGGSVSLVFDANNTTTIPYPASAGTGPVTMTYTLGAESVVRSTTFPEACTVTTTTGVTTSTAATTTSTTGPPTTTGPTTTTGVTTTLPGVTTTIPGTTTSLPTTFTFGAAATVCVSEVPTIRIVFQNQFPQLAGQTGILTMADMNGLVVSVQPLVYQPGATVDLLYPGTAVNPDGSIADVPGWNLNAAGFWVRDPSDEFLREGIQLTFTVNPTATATVTYPPESANCANPDGPFPPGTPIVPPGAPPAPGQPGGPLPPTGGNNNDLMIAAILAIIGGGGLLIGTRRPKG